MQQQPDKPSGTFGVKLGLSVALHAAFAAMLFFRLPTDQPKPEPEQSLKVEMVPDPEKKPEKKPETPARRPLAKAAPKPAGKRPDLKDAAKPSLPQKPLPQAFESASKDGEKEPGAGDPSPDEVADSPQDNAETKAGLVEKPLPEPAQRQAATPAETDVKDTGKTTTKSVAKPLFEPVQRKASTPAETSVEDTAEKLPDVDLPEKAATRQDLAAGRATEKMPIQAEPGREEKPGTEEEKKSEDKAREEVESKTELKAEVEPKAEVETVPPDRKSENKPASPTAEKKLEEQPASPTAESKPDKNSAPPVENKPDKTEPKLPPSTLPKAKKLYAADTLSNPRVHQALGKLPPNRRIVQICSIEALEQVRHARPDRLPDFLVPFSEKGGLIQATVLQASGGAYRSRGLWYEVAFECTVTKPVDAITAFRISVGDAIPKNTWRKRRLPVD